MRAPSFDGRRDDIFLKLVPGENWLRLACRVIPLFSNASEPGLIVVSDAACLSGCYAVMRHEFGDRVWREMSEFDCPDGAEGVLAAFDDASLNLVDGEIVPL